MKVGLASVRLWDGEAERNLAAMEKAAREAEAKGADLCCFGESALQGFNCLCWDFETDRNTCVSVDSPLFRRICAMSREIGIDLLFGFMERDGDALYSSCALVADGSLLRLYRRVSRGWKEFTRTDSHYREGEEIRTFRYRGLTCMIALCGDLWDDTAPLFADREPDLLLWPVYVCYTPEEWEEGVGREYAEKAAAFSSVTLFVNSICEHDGQPDAYGGCSVFLDGRIDACLPMGEEGILIADV